MKQTETFYKTYAQCASMSDKWPLRHPSERPSLNTLKGKLKAKYGENIAIIGQKAMGRTALALSFALNQMNARVAVLSFEIGEEVIIQRLLKMLSLGVPEKERLKKVRHIKVKRGGKHDFNSIQAIQKQLWWDRMDVIILDGINFLIDENPEEVNQWLGALCKETKAKRQLLITTVNENLTSQIHSEEVNRSQDQVYTKYVHSWANENTSLWEIYRPEYEGVLEIENGQTTSGRAEVKMLQLGESKFNQTVLKFNANIGLFFP